MSRDEAYFDASLVFLQRCELGGFKPSVRTEDEVMCNPQIITKLEAAFLHDENDTVYPTWGHDAVA